MLRARAVLADCRVALRLLGTADEPATFRVQFAACCALLRTVGHVLEKVDRKDSPQHMAAIDAAYGRWRADRSKYALFWDFIENERNRILKEYDQNIVYGGHMFIYHNAETGEALQEEVGSDLYVPLGAGPFQGEDVRDMVDHAIGWWELELNLIEGV